MHGRGFWIRPLIVEVAGGLIFAWLYDWELRSSVVLLRPFPGIPLPAADFLSSNLPLVIHARYLSRALSLALMAVASLIDLDEQTIPDTITLGGTLTGLALAAIYPWSLPPAADWVTGGTRLVEFLTLSSPEEWPAGLGGLPERLGLAVAIGCWTLWCGGLLPRRFTVRARLVDRCACVFSSVANRVGDVRDRGHVAGGLGRDLRRGVARAGGQLGGLGLGAGRSGGRRWSDLDRADRGCAALGREAMGFGDVTLMSMIGAFVGWQAAPLIFFIGPCFGLVLGVLRWIARGEHELPYGPFLCLATLTVVLNWTEFWNWGSTVFILGWIVPALVVPACADRGDAGRLSLGGRTAGWWSMIAQGSQLHVSGSHTG